MVILVEAVSNMASSRLSLSNQGTPIDECGEAPKEHSSVTFFAQSKRQQNTALASYPQPYPEQFREVQAQFRGKVNCTTRSTHFALRYTVYEVVEQVSNSTFNKFAVTYDNISAEVKSQCLLFESRGILCHHSLSGLIFEQNILEGWSKNVKRRHTHIKTSHDEPLLEPRSKKFDNLVFRSQNICEFVSESEELTVILHCSYDNAMVEMQEYKAKSKGKCSLSHKDASLEDNNELQSPRRVRTRGCPKNRLGSKMEKQIANASKKKKMKALSELNLFYGGSVVQSNSSQYHGYVMNYQFRDSKDLISCPLPTDVDVWCFDTLILFYQSFSSSKHPQF
ncbi:hypothetical protein Ahy_B05g077147 [Arachis hypogaea]|uniref:Protein FAR1-RELATED SEQUENCE n=1 Tax=Arachis hypogaea TaxID=3818 RepID=A0A444Z4E9_ARAHY|nr:hypothetical protein Ahy_B05g077147 [Arachis hypogaea]